MSGLLGDVYSYGDSLKRKLRGLLADPVGTIALGVTRFGEDQQAQNDLSRTAYPFSKIDPTPDPQAQQAARNKLAELMTGQALGGMFVGQGAKTWDAIAAKKAEELTAKGVDPRTIWKETGTWKAPDGAWRQEVDDSASSIKNNIAKQFNDYGVRMQKTVFNHDPLYAAYPEVGEIATLRKGVSGGTGEYDGKNIFLAIPRKAPDTAALRDTNLHELQHAIQQREGWATGGNPESMSGIEYMRQARQLRREGLSGDELEKKLQQFTPFGQYQRLAGEAEARATQARMNLTADQRRALFPADSYDVPLDQLIIRRDEPVNKLKGLLGK